MTDEDWEQFERYPPWRQRHELTKLRRSRDTELTNALARGIIYGLIAGMAVGLALAGLLVWS